MHEDDRTLMEAHLAGDSAAFERIIARYGGAVLDFLTKMCTNTQQAEDLFQETFERAHEKAHTFRGDGLKPWLFRIAANLAIDGLRRQKRIRFVSLNREYACENGNCTQSAIELTDNSANPADEAESSEQKRLVRRLIRSLPEKQRAVLILAYYQQLTYPEVAAALRCSLGTVKTHMFRALRTIARKMPDVHEPVQ